MQKRLCAIILAVWMVFSTVAPAFAQGQPVAAPQDGELPFTTEVVNGMTYKVYDLAAVSASEKTRFRRAVRPLAVGDTTRWSVTVEWGTFDLEFPAGQEIWIQDEQGEKRGVAELVASDTKAIFTELPGFDPNKTDYMLLVPDLIDFDIRIDYAIRNDSTFELALAVQQIANPFFEFVWNDDGTTTRPDFIGRFVSAKETNYDFYARTADPLGIFSAKIGDQGKVYRRDPGDKDTEFTVASTAGPTGLKGRFSKEDLVLTAGIAAPERIRAYWLDENEAVIPQGTEVQGYFLNTYGDHLNIKRFVAYKVVEVNFNSGEGKFTEEGSANEVSSNQKIGYGEKIADNESGRTITVPTTIAPEGQKLAGWSKTDGGTAMTEKELNALQFTDAVTTLYAVYEKDSEQFVSITAASSDTTNSTVATEGNPVEVSKGSAWSAVKDSVSALVTPKEGYSIVRWMNGDAEVTDETVFNEDTTVTAQIKKSVVDTDPQDDDYVKITFKSDADENTQNGGYFGTEDAKEETIEKWVLKVAPRTDITVPTPVANTGFNFNAWDTAWPENAPFTKDETYTATWTKEKDIIGPNPTDPKPEGYVTVEFLKGANGTLSSGTLKEQNRIYYYINPEAGKTMADITEPTINPATGWKATEAKWNPALVKSTAITTDLTYTAQYEQIGDIIGPNPTDPKPEGYVTVEFLKGANGTLSSGTLKEQNRIYYYINPEAGKTMADITEPTINPATGWKATEAKWNPALVKSTAITTDLTYTAQYEQIGDIIGPNPTDPKPEGYVTVEFLKGANGTLSSGTLKEQNRIYYYINPEAGKTMADITEPTINPATGWKATEAKWNPALVKSTAITTDLTYTAQYEQIGDIIGPNPTDPKPEGYVTVAFNKGDHGTLTAGDQENKDSIIYYVNPEAGKTMADITEPTINPATGWKATEAKWNPALDTTTAITKDLSYIAQYTKEGDIIGPINPDKPDPNDPKVPDGYVTVTFNKGEHGTLTSGDKKDAATIIYYVNPTADPKVTMAQITPPTINPHIGYKAADAPWDPAITGTDEITANKEFTAQYTKLDNIIGPNPATPKPNGYVTVKFLQGEGGTLNVKGGTPEQQGLKEVFYYVNPTANKTMADIAEPEITANVGYTVADQKWAPALDTTTAITGDLSYTAQYTELDNIIPVNPVDPDQPFKPEDKEDPNNDHKTPEGYVRVIFDAADGNFGEYANSTTNPKAPIKKIAYDVKGTVTWATFKANIPSDVKPAADGFKFANSWEPVIPQDADKVTEATYVAQYTELDNIIGPVDPTDPKPEGYVTVSFASYLADVSTTPAQNTGGKIVYEGKEYEKISFWVKKGVKYSQLMKEIIPSDEYIFKPTAEDATNRPSVKIADKEKLDFIGWSPGLGYHGNKDGNGKIADETVEAAITRIFGERKESVTHHAKWAAPILPYTPSDTDDPVNDTDAKKEKDKLPENYVELYKVIGFNTDGNGKLVVNDEEKEAQSYLVLYKLKWEDIQNIIPETKGKPDFTFDKWDPVVPTTGPVVKKSSYKALFKDGRGIIPDPDNNIEKPGEDYVKVHFLLRDDDKNANAATLKGVEHFWVKKGTNFPLEKAPTIVPNEPYKVGQKLWYPMLPVVIEENTDIYALIMKDGGTNTQEPVIPVNPENPDKPFYPEKPDDNNNGRKTEEDQVRIIFYADENGNFGLYNESKTDPKTEIKKIAYDVKKGTAWTTIIDYVPMIHPHEGYEVANPEWKPVLPDYSVLAENGEKEFHAQYVAISEKPAPEIIPTTPEDKDKDDPNPGEEATHVLVTFDKGDHGELAGKRMFWVKKGTAGSDLEAQAPQIVPNAGYDVADPSWDPAVPETIDEESTHVAQYVEKEDDSENIIPDPDNNIPKPSDDYVKVTFLPGDNGKLNGERMFWVKKGTTFPSNMAPQITPNSGYSVAPQRWNPTLPMLIEKDTTFTAVYNKDTSTNIPEVPKPQEPIYWGSFTPVTAPKEKLEMDGIHHAYIFGYLNGTVRPDGKITRAEAAAMLARLKGLDLDNGFAPNFKDTKNDAAWYNKVINAVVKAGYMRGYPDGTFRPENPITRAEFAKMIMPVDKANSAVAPFEDVKGHWAEVAINQGYGNKRLHGYPDGKFRPDAYITRAEAAKIFNRLFDRLVTEQGLRTLENPKDLKYFIDLDTRHWAYYELLEATNTHEYFRLEKGGVEEGWIRVLNH